MASTENDESNLEHGTRSTAQPNDRQRSSPPEDLASLPPPKDLALSPPQEDDEPRSLVSILDQETDIVAFDVPPQGLVLLTPPEHEPKPSNMITVNQGPDIAPWTASRKPLEGHLAPPSALPAWRYISPREQNPAARMPTAMAHRAHTPLPQFANARTPDATPMLTEYKQHGITTYSSESTEEIGLDLNGRDDRDVLSYTDKVPMAGKYLRTAEYRAGMKEQEDMLEEYSERDVLDAKNADAMHKASPRVSGK
ncbi:hypothetical protein MBLNU13_g01254t1 [Cladosporium sp. NU13]